MIWGLAIVALLVGLYWLTYRPHTYRYKMTVEVDTPEGVKTGSAVREVKWIPQPQWLSANEFSFKQRGEAVAVDLPGGQTLFVLLNVDGHETIRAGFGQGRETDVKKMLDQADDDRELYVYPSPDTLRAHNLSFPPLVRFRDANKPETVERVDPSNLTSSFGERISLNRITMQITDEPVDSKIEKRFSWWHSYRQNRLRLNGKKGAIFSNDLADNLGTGAFKAGDQG